MAVGSQTKGMYIELLKDIYTNSSMTVHVHKKATRSTSGRQEALSYHPSCLWKHSKAYYDD